MKAGVEVEAPFRRSTPSHSSESVGVSSAEARKGEGGAKSGAVRRAETITHTRRQFIMTDAPTRQFHPTKNDRLQSARAKRLGSYERRLKAAGLSQDDDVPKDKEEFYG